MADTIKTTALAFPDTTKITRQADENLELAKEMLVLDEETYDIAAEFLSSLKGLQKEIDETFDPVIKAQHEAHKAALAAKARHYKPIEEAERLLKQKMVGFQDRQEKARLEEERQLRDEARRQEEEERSKRADDLIKAGKAEEALQLLEEPVETPALILPPVSRPTKGVSTRMVWKFKIVDETKLPREYLVPDQVKINRIVQAADGKIAIPGVEIFQERQIAAR